MRIIPRIFVATLAVALMLSGCVPTTPSASPTPKTSATPVFASEAEALAAATKAYAAYSAMSDQILQDGGANPDRIKQFATSEWSEVQLAGFADAEGKGWHSSGVSKFENVTLQNFDEKGYSEGPIVSVYMCVDVSDVNVFDSLGSSQVSPNRPDRAPFQVDFELRTPPKSNLVVSNETPWAGTEVC